MTMREQAIALIDEAVPDARQGLPQDVFFLVSRLTPLVNVDLLIHDDNGRTLLSWRADQFYGPGWHVPGGIIRFKESWGDRITAVARSELGAGVTFEPNPLLVRQPMTPSRATRGHFISLLFACRLTSAPDPERQWRTGAPQNGQWAWHSDCPDDLIREHEMFRDSINGVLP